VRKDLLNREVNNSKLLKDITVPLLLTHGDKDRIILPLATFNQKKLTPHAKISIFENVGHMPFWETADKFNRELKEFANECFKI